MAENGSVQGREYNKQADERNEKVKKICVFIICTVFFCLSYGAAADEMKDAHQKHQHRHLKYAKIKNPIAKTDKSVAEGKRLYEKYCIACHGEAGKGGMDPHLAGSVRIHGSTDGEMFHIITDGVAGTTMKGFRSELPDEMRWHLVNYIASSRKSEIKK